MQKIMSEARFVLSSRGKKYFNFYPLFLLYYAVRETIGEVVYKYTQRDHTTLSAWSASR